jgi:molecular chaperone DnaK
VPQIEVTFDIDANGIVNVEARDKATGRRQAITITASSGLNEEEIQRMVKEAEAYAEEDRKRRERVEARNALDNLIYSVEKTLREHRDKLSSEDVSSIEAALKEARDTMESDDIEKLRAATDKLMQASHKLAEHMYQAATGATAGSGSQQEGPKPPEDDVVDAEFEDVDKS